MYKGKVDSGKPMKGRAYVPMPHRISTLLKLALLMMMMMVIRQVEADFEQKNEGDHNQNNLFKGDIKEMNYVKIDKTGTCCK
jgi:hypothetical protein